MRRQVRHPDSGKSIRLLGGLLAPLILIAVRSASAADVDDGETLFRTGKYAECAKMAASEIERGNYREEWRQLKVSAELAQGSFEAALNTVEDALSTYPSSVSLRLLAHTVYRFNGQSARADTELDLIERLALSSPRRYSNPNNRIALGRFFLRRRADARQVLEVFYDPVTKNWPDYVDAHLATAELSLEKYDNALAAETLTKAPESAKRDPYYHYLLARAYREDDAEAATAAVAAALAINPRHTPTLLLQVEHLIDAEQYDAAADGIAAILAINPREPLAWAYNAVLAHLANDPKGEKAAREQALACWSTNPEVDHAIGRKLSDKYRFAEGAAYQRRSLEMDASYMPARMQLSQDLLRLGREDEGWQLAADVFDADGYNVVAHNLVTLHDTVKNYQILTNESFRVRMEAREAAIYGQRVLELLDEAKATLCEKYDSPLDEPIAVEIFPQQKDFAVRTFGLPGADGFLGVCFGNVITANSPAALGQTTANWKAVLWHEFCHVVTLRKSRNKMPRWLSEGISVYEEQQADPSWGQAMTPKYRQMILEGEMPPVSQLSGAFLAPKSAMHLQFAYFQSSLVVEYIVENFGLDALKQVLADLGAGMQIEESLVRNVAPLNRLDAQFEKFARQRAEQLGAELNWDEPELPPRAGADAVAEWLKEHPDNFAGLTAWSAALQREQQWKESVAPAKRLRELFPEYVGPRNAYVLLAKAHRELGDAAAEREALEAWAKLSADAVDAYQRLMELAEENGDWRAAADNARRVLAVNPLTPAPHRALARAAEQLGQPIEAIAAYRALLQFDTTDPVDVHYRLAQLLHEHGDRAGALRHLLMALEDAPRFLDAHHLLLQLTGDSPEAATPENDAPSDEPADSDRAEIVR